jgi:choline dehydrogenase-like flavoprotein
VHYKDANGTSRRATGRYFVLAANGIETPKLLLISADGRHQSGHGCISLECCLERHPAFAG